MLIDYGTLRLCEIQNCIIDTFMKTHKKNKYTLIEFLNLDDITYNTKMTIVKNFTDNKILLEWLISCINPLVSDNTLLENSLTKIKSYVIGCLGDDIMTKEIELLNKTAWNSKQKDEGLIWSLVYLGESILYESETSLHRSLDWIGEITDKNQQELNINNLIKKLKES